MKNSNDLKIKKQITKQEIILYILKGFLSGFIIGLGGLSFVSSLSPIVLINKGGQKLVDMSMVSIGTKYMAAILFCLALFFIFILELNLFTGKIGYFYEVKGIQKLRIFYVFFLNLFGCILFALLSAPILKSLGKTELISTIAISKFDVFSNYNDFFQFAAKGISCGIIIHLAIIGFRRCKNYLFKLTSIIIPILAFVLTGAEHSIANSYYYFAYIFSGNFDIKILYAIIVLVATNGIGSIFLQTMLGPLLNSYKELA